MTHNTKLQRIAQRGAAVDYVGEYQRRPEFVADFMARNAEHVTLGANRRPERHATTARFKRWLPALVYSQAPLMRREALPSFYGAAVTHMAMGFLHTARGRFGSDAVSRHFHTLAQAAKRRAGADDSGPHREGAHMSLSDLKAQPLKRTHNAALAKARKLWGKNPAIEYRAHLAGQRELRQLIKTFHVGTPWPRALYWATCKPCVVSVIELGLFFAVKGEGETFAEAFEAAERRARP